MATTIKIKRGLKENLPTLADGELAYCTDTQEMFIGTAIGNALVNQDIDTDEYVVSGYFDEETGDLNLTRTDENNIIVNLDNRYLQSYVDTNDYVNNATFSNGTLTLTRTDDGAVAVSLDGRYLQSFTETDPTVPLHVKGITETNISNWNTAYGWGDHASEGYLTSFTETDPVFLAQKGVAEGVATLDSAGKVPANQLPSYVDDVLEYADLNGFPATGETGKIYVAIDTNKTYRWTGTVYVEIANTLDFASQAEAEAGTNETKAMSPARTKDAILALTPEVDVSTEYSAGVIETNNSSNLKFWQGSQAQYDAFALATLVDETIWNNEPPSTYSISPYTFQDVDGGAIRVTIQSAGGPSRVVYEDGQYVNGFTSDPNAPAGSFSFIGNDTEYDQQFYIAEWQSGSNVVEFFNGANQTVDVLITTLGPDSDTLYFITEV